MSEKHIFGKLAECEKYLGINPLFEKAFAFLKRTDLAALPAGRQEIDGDRCWANVIDATLKPCAECKLEAHRRYIDIQMPVTGPEVIGIAEMDEAAWCTRDRRNPSRSSRAISRSFCRRGRMRRADVPQTARKRSGRSS